MIPVKVLGIDVAVVALAQDLLDAFEFFGEPGEVLFVRRKNALLDGLKFKGAQPLDTGVEAGGPRDDYTFGNVELLRDVIEAEAFGAEFDESVFGLVRVHSLSVVGG